MAGTWYMLKFKPLPLSLWCKYSAINSSFRSKYAQYLSCRVCFWNFDSLCCMFQVIGILNVFIEFCSLGTLKLRENKYGISIIIVCEGRRSLSYQVMVSLQRPCLCFGQSAIVEWQHWKGDCSETWEGRTRT